MPRLLAGGLLLNVFCLIPLAAGAQGPAQSESGAGAVRLHAVVGSATEAGTVHGYRLNSGLQGSAVGLGAEWAPAPWAGVGVGLQRGLMQAYGAVRRPGRLEPFAMVGFGRHVMARTFYSWSDPTDLSTVVQWSPTIGWSVAGGVDYWVKSRVAVRLDLAGIFETDATEDYRVAAFRAGVAVTPWRRQTSAPAARIAHPRDRLWNGILIGLGVGAAGGWAAAATFTCPNDPECLVYTSAVMIPIGAGVGALVGALVDHAR